MPHRALNDYDYDYDCAEEHFGPGYNLQATLCLVADHRSNICAYLCYAHKQPDLDAVLDALAYACAEAVEAAGLLTPEIEFLVGRKPAAEWRVLAAAERALWELRNRREHLRKQRELLYSTARANPVQKTVGALLDKQRKERELQLALRALEAFPHLMTPTDDDLVASETQMDDLSALLGAASLSAAADPTDELCALLQAADFSSPHASRAVPAPKKSRGHAWEELLNSSPLTADIGWLVTPPPNVLRAGETVPDGRFYAWQAVRTAQPVRVFEGDSDTESDSSGYSRRPKHRYAYQSDPWALSSRSPSPSSPGATQGGRRSPARKERYGYDAGPYRRERGARERARGREMKRRYDQDAERMVWGL